MAARTALPRLNGAYAPPYGAGKATLLRSGGGCGAFRYGQAALSFLFFRRWGACRGRNGWNVPRACVLGVLWAHTHARRAAAA